MNQISTYDAAPLQLSNEAFLQCVFGDQCLNAHVTSFSQPPDQLNGAERWCWSGGRWADCRQDVVVDQNSFFCISTFHPDENGKAVRRKAQHYATYVIVIDDVGAGASAKVSRARIAELGLPEPSYRLETSAGNEQWGYLLAAPCTDRALVENLLNQLVALKLCPDGSDPGMKGVTRYVRLPQGVNNKSKYPEPWPHRLNAWRPDLRYRVEDLAAVAGVDMAAASQQPRKDDGRDRIRELFDEWGPDPVLDALTELGLVVSRDGPGAFKVLCPNRGEHTDRVDEPIRYYRKGAGGNEYGGFSCFHGHCEGLSRKGMIKLLIEEYKDRDRPVPDALMAELQRDYGLVIGGS